MSCWEGQHDKPSSFAKPFWNLWWNVAAGKCSGAGHSGWQRVWGNNGVSALQERVKCFHSIIGSNPQTSSALQGMPWRCVPCRWSILIYLFTILSHEWKKWGAACCLHNIRQSSNHTTCADTIANSPCWYPNQDFSVQKYSGYFFNFSPAPFPSLSPPPEPFVSWGKGFIYNHLVTSLLHNWNH